MTSKTVISVENLSKIYTLGQIGTGTFSHDIVVWWARMRGKPNPLGRIGENDQFDRVGEKLSALNNVSFVVEQGEVIGIIGNNGAGKSTLLKILSRVTAPTSGLVKVKGRIASLLEVGTGFHPELTGRENIFLNGAILGMTKAEVGQKFDEIVDFSGVEKFIDTPVKRYSSGMYVRLAFAVAANLESEILLVDEVLAVGDAEFQKKCLGKMEDVAHHDGRTVIFVSHNMTAIAELCEKVIYLNNGSVKNIGNPIDTVNLYLDFSDNSQNPQTNKFSVTNKNFVVTPIDFEILNNGKLSYPNPTTNEDVIIRVKIYSKEELKNIAFGISVKNKSGVLLTSINSVEQGSDLHFLPIGESNIQIILKKVPYLPDQYFVNFWIMNPNGHIYLMDEGTIQFTLRQSKIYGTCVVDQRWGCVYTNVDFSVNNEKNIS